MDASSTRGAMGVGSRPAARSIERRVGEVEARIRVVVAVGGKAVNILGLFLGPGWGRLMVFGPCCGQAGSPGAAGPEISRCAWGCHAGRENGLSDGWGLSWTVDGLRR